MFFLRRKFAHKSYFCRSLLFRLFVCVRPRRSASIPIPLFSEYVVLKERNACWDCRFESRQGHGLLSCVLNVVSYRSLQRPDHSSRGVLPSVVCPIVISQPRQRGGLDVLGLSGYKKKREQETAVVVLRSPLVVFLLGVSSGAGSSTVF